MITENHQIYSSGSIQLFCSSWQPETSPEALLFIVHGLGEHLGRYEALANQFVKNNIAVFAFDHRGHGKSGGKKGHADSIEQFVEDVEHALMKCRSLFLDVPIYLYGHSMGGQIVAAYLDKVKSKEVSGAIVSSPWILIDHAPKKWQVRLLKSISKLFPSITLPNTLDPEHISSIKDEVDLYRKDPLVHNKISLGLFTSLYTKGKQIHQNAQVVNVPVLVSHGTDDKITIPDASRHYAELLGANAKYKSWKKSMHEPHHDFEKDKVVDFYVGWVKQQLKTKNK